MPGLIEDYAIIGNCESAAMVSQDGSIAWLALPRFDSAACFAALLGDPENGRRLITRREIPPSTAALDREPTGEQGDPAKRQGQTESTHRGRHSGARSRP